MHKRIVSYVLFLATIIAVILIVIVQPRANKQQKKAMHRNAPFFADTCASADCENNTTKALAKLACDGVLRDSTCQVASICDGEACNPTTCGAAGYTWDVSAGVCLTGGDSGSSGVSSAPPSIDSNVVNKAVKEGIESECRTNLPTELMNFKNAIEACKRSVTLAYLASQGNYNADPQISDYLIQSGDIIKTLLFTAFSNIPAQKPDQFVVEKRLKDIMNIMEAFYQKTNDPQYLQKPEESVALLQKQLESLNEPEEEVKEVKEEVKEVEKPSPKIMFDQIVARLTGNKNLTEIRVTGIKRANITLSLGTLQKIFLKTQKIIKTFDTCLKEDVC